MEPNVMNISKSHIDLEAHVDKQTRFIDLRDIDVPMGAISAETISSYYEVVKDKYANKTLEEIQEYFDGNAERLQWISAWLDYILEECYDIAKEDEYVDPVKEMNRRKKFAMRTYELLVENFDYVHPMDAAMVLWAKERFDLFLEAHFLEREDLLNGIFTGFMPDMFESHYEDFCKYFLYYPFLVIKEYLDYHNTWINMFLYRTYSHHGFKKDENDDYIFLKRASIFKTIMLS